jgi:hypothetical protein
LIKDCAVSAIQKLSADTILMLRNTLHRILQALLTCSIHQNLIFPSFDMVSSLQPMIDEVDREVPGLSFLLNLKYLVMETIDEKIDNDLKDIIDVYLTNLNIEYRFHDVNNEFIQLLSKE